MPNISIKCKRPGFRRAGRAWPAETILDAGELTGEQGRALMADPMFTITEVDPSTLTSVSTGNDPLIDVLVKAIDTLDPKNKKHFTGKGVPEIKALEQIVNGKISAKQRDAAWKIAKPAK